MAEGIRTLDFFRFTPTKFIEQTITGALISLGVIALAIYLVLSEVNLVLNEEVRTEILFENLHMEDLQVNIDIDINHIPCELLDMRFTSLKGRQHTIERKRLTRGSPNPIPMKPGRGIEEINQAIDSEEGCKISGTFYLHFLANNFHITYSNPMIMARIVQMRGGDYTFELPHTIQSLTYGPLTDTSGYEKDYELKGFNTLKGYMGKEERDDGYSGPYQHAYSITAIPNIFDRAFGRLLETFQYTASYYHKRDMTLNAIVFR